MQATRPEWASLHAQFTPLALNDRILWIQDELEALRHEIEAQRTGVYVVPDSLPFRLRKIQQYVEWTVPDLVPDRAEEAEILVNIGRFAAQLLVQSEAWKNPDITTTIAHQLQAVSAIHSRV